MKDIIWRESMWLSYGFKLIVTFENSYQFKANSKFLCDWVWQLHSPFSFTDQPIFGVCESQLRFIKIGEWKLFKFHVPYTHSLWWLWDDNYVRDWMVCSKYNNHSRLNNQYNQSNLYDSIWPFNEHGESSLWYWISYLYDLRTLCGKMLRPQFRFANYLVLTMCSIS